MSKILLVHRTQWNAVYSNHSELLQEHNVVILRYPITEAVPVLPPTAEVCCIGLRPKQATEALCHLGLCTDVLKRYNDLRGAHATEFRAWISDALPPTTGTHEEESAASSLPWPGYKAYILNETSRCPRLILSKSALNRADKVVDHKDMYGSHFVRFVRDAVNALIFVASSSVPLDLQAFLRGRHSLEYAPTGGDFTAKYTNPFSGRNTATRRHLKPATERKGFYPSEQKPRLYFDHFTHPETQESWVVFLYFGPHPTENTDSEFVLPDITSSGKGVSK